jgi:hypothetical protein
VPSTARRRGPTTSSPREGALHIEVVAKPGGSRSIVRLDEIDRLAYQAAVVPAVGRIERSLSGGVFANRAVITPAGLTLSSWRHARRRYRRALETSAGRARAAFVGDVRDCYGSITPAAVARGLRRAGVPGAIADRIDVVLRSFQDRGVRGLPIGPEPSAVLANLVLSPLDEVVARTAGAAVLRWVDDVVVPTAGRRQAERARASFVAALLDLGLAPQDRKCRVLDDLAELATAASAASPALRGVVA